MFKMQSTQSAWMVFFVIICPVDDRQTFQNYLSLTNMLIQSGWALRRSLPSHNLHWFIISQFIFTLFIDLNFSLLLSIMMPEVSEVSRCTWFVNVSGCWAILAKLWQEFMTMTFVTQQFLSLFSAEHWNDLCACSRTTSFSMNMYF